MFTLIATVHVIVALTLILLVLVQDSKGGAGMFAGSGSQSILGATGGATLFSKMTRVAALLFAVTCIMLTIYTSKQGTSVVDSAPLPATSTTPTATSTATQTATQTTAQPNAQGTSDANAVGTPKSVPPKPESKETAESKVTAPPQEESKKK